MGCAKSLVHSIVLISTLVSSLTLALKSMTYLDPTRTMGNSPLKPRTRVDGTTTQPHTSLNALLKQQLLLAVGLRSVHLAEAALACPLAAHGTRPPAMVGWKGMSGASQNGGLGP